MRCRSDPLGPFSSTLAPRTMMASSPSGGFWNAPENTRHSTARNTATAAITTMFTAQSHGRGIGALFPCFHAHFQRKKRPKHTADSISQR